jgi:hypothetical protein
MIKLSDVLDKLFDNYIEKNEHLNILEQCQSDEWISFVNNIVDVNKEKYCRDIGNFHDFIQNPFA